MVYSAKVPATGNMPWTEQWFGDNNKLKSTTHRWMTFGILRMCKPSPGCLSIVLSSPRSSKMSWFLLFYTSLRTMGEGLILEYCLNSDGAGRGISSALFYLYSTSTRGWTQGLQHARQATTELYPSPFYCFILRQKLSKLPRLASDLGSSWLSLLNSWD